MSDRSALARAGDLIRAVPDFPEPGVVFRDITGLLADAAAFRATVDSFALIAHRIGGIDLIAGIEARGFLVGAPVATHLGVGFVPIRKVGKLPPPTERVSYDLEYGRAEVETRREIVPPGSRVLVIDDVLATGGTAAAGAQLLERLGAEVVALAFLLELVELAGRDRLAGRKVEALLRVES